MNKNELQHTNTGSESILFSDISTIIEKRKNNAISTVNNQIVLMFWEIGNHINSVILGMERAEYGKRIVATLSQQLTEKYGKNFEKTNLNRMMQFATQFPDFEKLSTLWAQLSWSHIRELLPLKTTEEKLYYAEEVKKGFLGVRDLRHLIARKAFLRRDNANLQLTRQSKIPFNAFKDPVILDTLGLKDNYLEGDLEQAILHDIENFILEFGVGFTFAARQKRISIENDDYYIDLLFYNRDIKRLIAIELKIGKFKPAYKGQMELYLNWLNKYDRREGEEAPIGLILCTDANRKIAELMELDKSGIAVAEYWTKLPSKKQFESKIQEIMVEAKERIERRKLFEVSNIQKSINYFLEESSDELDDKD
ncbi:PDDEXK nuclease domain-containing protein [Odoribacter sp. OttesenSCG-928-L07]|nr:PDDEXK nuclease domain-containing protein [Odoribacter sp. OttesenSCG-928-L07]